MAALQKPDHIIVWLIRLPALPTCGRSPKNPIRISINSRAAGLLGSSNVREALALQPVDDLQGSGSGAPLSCTNPKGSKYHYGVYL